MTPRIYTALRMTSSRRLTLIISSVTLVLVIAGGFAAFFLFRRPIPLLSLLPADRTEAFFGRTLLEEAQTRFGDWYPILREIPPASGTVSIALVRGNDGAIHWILSPETEGAGVSGMTATSFKGTSLFAPAGLSPDALVQKEDENALLNDGQFLALTAGDRAANAYVRTLPEHPVSPALHLLLGEVAPATAGPMVFTFSGLQSATVRFLTSHTPLQSVALKALPAGLLVNARCVSVADGNLLLRLLVPEAEPNPIGDALRSAAITDLFGGEMSLPYDVLPLLAYPAAGCIADTNDGHRSALFLGTTESSRDDWNRFTQALHESFEREGGQGRVERKMLDGKYAYAVVKSGEAAHKTSSRSENGWQITETLSQNGSGGLLTARRGTDVLMTTDPAWLAAVTDARPPLALRDGSGTPLLSFAFHARDIDPLLLPAGVDVLARSLMASAADVRGIVEIGNGIGSLTLTAH